jgi:hypothetical protein
MESAKDTKVIGRIQAAVANPSPLGLFGLAMVTLIASTNKLGITSGTAYIIPWALFLGAAAQLMAGILDYKVKNNFGATAFCGYGFFWLAVSMTWMIGNGMLSINPGVVTDISQLGFAFLGYFIFSIYMTIGAMGTNKALFTIFVLIDVLFLGLFISTLNPQLLFWKYLAGSAELGISFFSFYASAANVLNSHYGLSILPLGKPFGPWVEKSIQKIDLQEEYHLDKAS